MLRRLIVPALGIAGGAVGLFLTKRTKALRDAVPKAREAIPELPEGGIGELTGDLRSKLESVIGGGARSQPSIQPRAFDTRKFEKRRAERRQRRERRRRRATT
jgi:hypothetical protein